jgi:hypothetical protein
MENEGQKKHNWMRLFVIVVLALICLIFVVYRYRSFIYAEMDALKLLPEPERFTELYFTDPAAIPTSTVAGQTMSFAFTIQNLEGVTTTYPYTSYFEDATGGTTSLANGIISLPDNASASIPVSYTFPASVNGEVVVNLPTLGNQQIDFLLPYNN